MKVEESKILLDIETDESGLPIRATELVSGIAPPGLEEVFFYFRLSGSPGEHVLTVDVKSYVEELDSSPLSFSPLAITIGPDRVSHITIPLETKLLPMGAYRFTLKGDGEPLEDFSFSVGFGEDED